MEQLTIKEQGEPNQYMLLDDKGNWVAMVQMNGEMTVEKQREVLRGWGGGGIASTIKHLQQISKIEFDKKHYTSAGQINLAIDVLEDLKHENG